MFRLDLYLNFNTLVIALTHCTLCPSDFIKSECYFYLKFYCWSIDNLRLTVHQHSGT